MKTFAFRFTFYLNSSRAVVLAVRKEFGLCLRKFHLKYRTEYEYSVYLRSDSGAPMTWKLDFLISPPEGMPLHQWKNLEDLIATGLQPFLDSHPEVEDVTMFRNVYDYPDLLQNKNLFRK